MDNVQGAVHKDSIDGFPMSFRGLKGGHSWERTHLSPVLTHCRLVSFAGGSRDTDRPTS